MSLVTIGDHSVIRGTIMLPRIGVWTADLELDADADLSGATTISVAEGPDLVGTFLSGTLTYGLMCARIAGGAGGLGKTATPKHYTQATVRTVLTDLVKTAGETLSATIADDILATPLTAWTTLAVPIGNQIATLVGCGLPAGTAWRILADGTLWIGAETWPTSNVEEWREFARVPSEGRLELGLDSANLFPGTILGEDRIDYVEHRIDVGVRARAWLA